MPYKHSPVCSIKFLLNAPITVSAGAISQHRYKHASEITLSNLKDTLAATLIPLKSVK